jgi:CRISPR-associated protein Cmr1
MESITFTCETITPMFLAGADGVTPELRAPSIKGAMRFWWRAVNGDLGLNELREREESIFGGTNSGGRSKLILRAFPQPSRSDWIRYEPTPHKGGFSKWAITPRFQFQLIINRVPNCPLSRIQIVNLLYVISIVGGIGNRSRRGFGAFRIKNSNDEINNINPSKNDLLTLIQSINSNFQWKRSYELEYPILLDVELDNKPFNSEKIVQDFGQATHDIKSRDRRNYTNFIGDSGPRFSSPIYLSAFSNSSGDLFKVASTLKTANQNADNSYLNSGLNLQKDLINQSLK